LGTIQKEMKTSEFSNTIEAILAEALNRMPNTFTTNAFGKTARALGLVNAAKNPNVYRDFLLKERLVRASTKIWFKTHPAINILEDESQPKIPFPAEVSEDAIKNAIALLKANGYRISKKYEQWIEV
jgi:hypothetical protein